MLDSFALLQAFPAMQREQLEALKHESPFDPAPQDHKTPGNVSVPKNEAEDKAKKEEAAKREALKVRRNEDRTVDQGLSDTKTRGMQLSHLWIIENILSLEQRGLIPQHRAALLNNIEKFQRMLIATPDAQAPYDRWIIMVTGKQKVRHEQKHGHHYEIRKPLLELPNNILQK